MRRLITPAVIGLLLGLLLASCDTQVPYRRFDCFRNDTNTRIVIYTCHDKDTGVNLYVSADHITVAPDAQ